MSCSGQPEDTQLISYNMADCWIIVWWHYLTKFSVKCIFESRGLLQYAIAVRNASEAQIARNLYRTEHLFQFSNHIEKLLRARQCKCSALYNSSKWCRIWSWSLMPCEKHGPRDSVDKNRGRRPKFSLLLRPEGHAFHTAWETMIKSY